MRQFALLFSLFFSPIALAQGANDAVVVGSVTDLNHAGVSSAIITLTHVATQAVTQVIADAEGRYRTPPLRIGEYVLSVQSPGFKELKRTGITLSIGDIREINAELLVGQVSQSVSVSDQPPLLQTSDSSVGTVITNKQIVGLPLNGRDYLQLAVLSAGTVPARRMAAVSVLVARPAARLHFCWTAWTTTISRFPPLIQARKRSSNHPWMRLKSSR
jgi:hypothetical protein